MWCRHLHIARQICVDVVNAGFGKIWCSGTGMPFTAAKRLSIGEKIQIKIEIDLMETNVASTYNSDQP